ncbi:hypothetical protein TSUD_365750 [Trifolium subterraneum]|uniref:Uncharacterized protein n=1 Tax=Trifolium subterraneum TaxID=3900 RepID=A0A2Z6P6D9_TRISU|nr:hypothetical protein TSUD_365750 [Trifolium subterraneum]
MSRDTGCSEGGSGCDNLFPVQSVLQSIHLVSSSISPWFLLGAILVPFSARVYDSCSLFSLSSIDSPCFLIDSP